MPSQTRMSAREEERRLNMQTLVIASAASATAAVITSQLWVAGTWIAAALTPVIVAVVSELLHRPTAVVAERVTAKRGAMLPARASADPGSEAEPGAPPVRMYRSGSGRGNGRAPVARPNRRKVAIGVVAVTAALAFAITAIAITGTELVTGGSIGKGERETTLFGGGEEAQDGQAPRDVQSTPAQGEGEPKQGEQQPQPQQEGEQTPEADPPEAPQPAPDAPQAPAPVEP